MGWERDAGAVEEKKRPLSVTVKEGRGIIALCSVCDSLCPAPSNICETWICPSLFLMTQAPSGHLNTPQSSQAGLKEL